MPPAVGLPFHNWVQGECRGKSHKAKAPWLVAARFASAEHFYCAADLLPSGEPAMGVPGGSGRAAIE